MRSGIGRRLRAALLACAFVTAAVSAYAEEPQAQQDSCAAGVEQAQLSRQEGKLLQSRQALLTCVRTTCPRVIQEQCAVWLDEVDTLTPSVVVRATAAGEDRSDITITIDGAVIDTETGNAIPLDPGPHTFVFTYPGHSPVRKKMYLNEGERRLPIVVDFDTPKPTAAPTAIPRLKRYEHPVPMLTYVLAGVAVVGAGTFTYLGLSSEARRDQLERDCAPSCPAADVSDLETRSLAANISLGVGGAALAGALISYLVRPAVEVEDPIATQLVVTPAGASVHAAVTF